MTGPERIFITILVVASLLAIGWSIGWQFANAPYAGAPSMEGRP